ncbi:hypothetical protein N7517_009298 [Penicillium concentricum]|uniref:Uncharacterized protein n=1 Tax=Penicillium concentricum TaxID=293559 RepID=A0A9W9RHE0_9EURO|nr:uncharacterized protein N7517_009298 [Penicillium concentricum]KAJ5360107.1 hypothetical protein N7517_009298 [Penicillium concentricum]
MAYRGPPRHGHGHGHGHRHGHGQGHGHTHGHGHRDSAAQGSIDRTHRELYVQICYEVENAVHWMIIMRHPGDERCIRLHSTGCMGDRTYSVEDDMRFDSHSVASTHYLGTIHEADSWIVEREAEKIPLQSCQLWAFYLILRLERNGLIKDGQYKHFMNCYKHSRREDYGPGDDFHDCPVHRH